MAGSGVRKRITTQAVVQRGQLPFVPALRIGERDCRRIVLGDWYEHGSVLRVTPGHYDLQALAPALQQLFDYGLRTVAQLAMG